MSYEIRMQELIWNYNKLMNMEKAWLEYQEFDVNLLIEFKAIVMLWLIEYDKLNVIEVIKRRKISN